LRRERIDAEFAGMKNDGESQRQAEAMADEFAYSDWEALRSAEKRAK
jgi:hypothetical protein